MRPRNQILLPSIALAWILLSIPFGELGGLAAYCLTASLVALACFRLIESRDYRLLGSAALTFAVSQILIFVDQAAAAAVLAVAGYLMIVGLGIRLMTRRTRRIETAILLETGGVACIGAMLILSVGKFLGDSTLIPVFQVITVGAAIAVLSSFMGRKPNKAVRAITLAIGLAVLLELAVTSIPDGQYDRLWSLVYLPVLYGLGLPKAEYALDRAPVPARRQFGTRQQILFNVGQTTPFVLIAVNVLFLDSHNLVPLVALSAISGVLFTLRFRLLVKLRDWSYEQEQKLRRYSEKIISLQDSDDLNAATITALHELVDGRGRVAIVETNDEGHRVRAELGEEPTNGRSFLRDVDYGDAIDATRNWFFKSTTGRARIAVSVPANSELDDDKNINFVASLKGTWSSDLADHFRSAASQYSLAIRANTLAKMVQIQRSNNRLSMLTQDTNDVVFLVDRERYTIVFAGPTLEKVLGYKAADHVGQNVLDLVHQDDLSVAFQELEGSSEGERAETTLDIQLRLADGKARWFEMSVRELSSSDAEELLVSFSDVNDRKLAGLNLRNSEAKFRALARNSLDVSMIVEEDLTIGYVGPNIESIFDFSAEHLIGSSVLGFVHTSSHDTLTALIDRTQSAAASQKGELYVRSAFSNETRLAEVAISPADVGSSSLVMIFRDITSRRQLEASLQAKAMYDDLTGVLNRSAFIYESQRATQAFTGDQMVSMIAIDLLDYRNISDSIGFRGSDRVLAEVAARLRFSLRETDLVARLSASEFALFSSVDSTDEAKLIAERLQAVLREPVSAASRTYKLSIAQGMTISSMAQTDTAELIQQAVVAMHVARERESEQMVMFEQSMQDEASERFELAADLRGALRDGEFSLVYQPLISLQDNRVTGFEALCRWNHPERGNISPAVFIPLAEANGSIIDLGRWVLEEACRQLVDWKKEHDDLADSQVSVNLSATQLDLEHEINTLTTIILESGLDPSALTIELTESTMTRDPSKVSEQLSLLRSLDVNIAIDDFGTGVSGLSHLRELPFDVVKIDKSYIDKLGVSAEGTQLVQQIVDLAAGMGAKTVAEGIETSEQAETLTGMGCDTGQGFYLARPMADEQVVQWVRERSAGRLVG